jgi:hypothetical protein
MDLEKCQVITKKYIPKKCEHNREKTKCKECGGSSFCEHNRRKSSCKECGGSSICEHNKIKSKCKECGGSSICVHNKQKTFCKECCGSSICEHNRQKSKCKECGGSSICEHNRIKTSCKDCGGSSICEHNKFKSKCKECGGSSICEHNKFKTQCKKCGGSSLCKNEFCETRKHKKYDDYCFYCFCNLFPDDTITRNYKTKELEVKKFILDNFPDKLWRMDKRIDGGSSKRRPDHLLDLGSHIIIIETDENKHTKYEGLYEITRINEISKDLEHRPIIFIRFNPDSYKKNGVKIPSCWSLSRTGILSIKYKKEWEKRLETLKIKIQECIEYKTDKTIEIIELFYNEV